MREFMHRVFVTDHFDRLHDRRDRKDAADHPVQVFLAARDAFHQPLTPKDEDTIPGQGSQPDADNVQVILIRPCSSQTRTVSAPG